MRKFTDVLEEYLDLREQLNSDYYDNRSIQSRSDARESIEELKIELDEFFNEELKIEIDEFFKGVEQ
jgi:hypothetical protein